jgi:hypothetical protein
MLRYKYHPCFGFFRLRCSFTEAMITTPRLISKQDHERESKVQCNQCLEKRRYLKWDFLFAWTIIMALYAEIDRKILHVGHDGKRVGEVVVAVKMILRRRYSGTLGARQCFG